MISPSSVTSDERRLPLPSLAGAFTIKMLSLPRRGLPGWTRSKFRVTDGTVANRPAVKGLAAKNVTVAGDQSTLA